MRKQTASHEDFVACRQRATAEVSKAHVDILVGLAVEEIQAHGKGLRMGYGWSGGKDSIALQYVAAQAGVTSGVYAATKGLEYPAFERWVAANTPAGVRPIINGWDLDWLTTHTHWMFPSDSAVSAKWYAGIQWKAQSRYIKEDAIDLLLVGRRYADGNNIPKCGISRKLNGEARYSPMRNWTHEEVFALIDHYALSMPPIYDWHRGYRVGTGPWAKRAGCASPEAAYEELWTIDPDIVRHAATRLVCAREYMRDHGLT